MPAFSGPWAASLLAAYKDATSDLQRSALADGQLSDGDISALQDDFQQCLSAAGYTDIAFTGDGGMSFKVPDGVTSSQQSVVVQQCQASTEGPVVQLYYEMQRNPSHVDEAALMAACLVRKGVVKSGYTGDDYAQDMASGSQPFDTTSVKFRACIADPTH